MLKLSKLTDYATVLLSLMAGEPQRLHNGHELAERSRIPAPTVAKLLKQLSAQGLLHSTRGAHGGYRLARSSAQISVAQIIAALEGPIAVTECAIHSGDCNLESDCSTRANWKLINLAIRQALEAVTLEQMARPGVTRATAERPVEHTLTFHSQA